MPDELFDIVTEDDVVTHQALRSVAHAQGLWHRGAHVFLFTSDGKMLIQKRSADRKQYASLWDCSVSEHVRAGETYMDGAHRGTREELGVSIPDLEPVFTFRMNYGPGDNEISTLFQGMVDPAQVKFDPEEIQSIAYFRLEELAELMKNQPQEFCGWFVQIVHWYMGQASDLVVLAESPGVRKG